MSRFASPEAVKAWADETAADDYARHLKYGISLNPFCTDGARNDWQRGFDGCAARPYEGTLDYDTVYQRGAAVRRIVDKENLK